MEPIGKRTGVTAGIPFFTYHEKGFRPIKKIRLSDGEYARVLQSKVLANTDIVFTNSAKRTIYLARRRALPMRGWFWMGGNRGGINEPLTQGLLATIEQETKLTTITPDRLVLRALMEYFWKDRSQAPQEVGCHMLVLTYSADITEEEAGRIVLDPNEYEEGVLREFTREDLVREGVFPSILDMYDLIFPPPTLRHVVLISFKEGIPQEVMQDVYNRYQTLADDCGGRDAGILSWAVERNLDLRKGIHLVEIAEFRDNDALQAFRVHPKHKEMTDILREVADWYVGDIMK